MCTEERTTHRLDFPLGSLLGTYYLVTDDTRNDSFTVNAKNDKKIIEIVSDVWFIHSLHRWNGERPKYFRKKADNYYFEFRCVHVRRCTVKMIDYFNFQRWLKWACTLANADCIRDEWAAAIHFILGAFPKNSISLMQNEVKLWTGECTLQCGVCTVDVRNASSTATMQSANTHSAQAK